jgi:hypothetical protein
MQYSYVRSTMTESDYFLMVYRSPALRQKTLHLRNYPTGLAFLTGIELRHAT